MCACPDRRDWLALGAGANLLGSTGARLQPFQYLAIQPRDLRAELCRAASRVHAQLLAAPVLDEPLGVLGVLVLDVDVLGEAALDSALLEELAVELSPLELSAFLLPPELL